MDKRFRILIVDDDEINIQLMTSALEDEYEILTAHSGYDAIRKLKKQIPDLILLDVMMPDMDGFDVCSSIKEDDSFADIPIIFLTSIDSPEGERLGFELGAIDYLPKPINHVLLKLRVHNHIKLKARNDLVKEQMNQLLMQKEELTRLLVELEHKNSLQRKTEEEKLILQQQFQQTQKLESLGVLSGGIAHDFNNILAIIIGYCSLTKMDFETAEDNILEIEKAAERAAGLCRQMLAYAGKAQLTKTHVNIRMLVDEMVTMLKSAIPQNAVIKPDLSANLPTIECDESQLRQIVMNLIINASEAIGKMRGEICVSLATSTIIAGQSDKDYHGKAIPPGQYVCLEVTDNGCGMDEETKWRIFEPFYTTKFTGRGLGMSAVLGIINSHDGALQLFSQLGQGTTFKVYLPVPISDTIGNEDQRPSVPSTSWKGSGTILLVEDEDQVRLIAKILLKKFGFTVLEAVNGKEALELYQMNAADITLVVTDMGMPVMDGYELFYELKNLNPELPIVISSGFGDAVVNSRIAIADIAGLISKPYNPDQLREVLKNVVERTKSVHS